MGEPYLPNSCFVVGAVDGACQPETLAAIVIGGDERKCASILLRCAAIPLLCVLNLISLSFLTPHSL